eukprot:92656-Rhodomonas_salina.1
MAERGEGGGGGRSVGPWREGAGRRRECVMSTPADPLACPQNKPLFASAHAHVLTHGHVSAHAHVLTHAHVTTSLCVHA